MRSFSRRFATVTILANAAVLTPLAAWAAPPAGVTEQGRLFDNTGNPLNASVSLTFSIYGAASGGAAVWTETQAAVSLDQGYFSVELGSVTPIPQSIWTGATLYVGVTVNADPEMTPRQPTYSVPYALVTNDAVGAIHPASVTVNGTLVIDSSGDWVGPSSGLLGPTGPAGANGAPGVTGATGTAGAQGAAGAAGPAGSAGPQGPEGPIGATGAQGAAGSAGVSGAQGAAGASGAAGSPGAQGAQGPAGSDGAAGATGTTGAEGATGATGPTGAQGPQGPAGATGATGAAGANGAQGAAGVGGAQGAAGSNGTDGASGAQGAAGASGATGATGADGVTGPIGGMGVTGPAGPMGPAGPAGATGAQGAAGSNGSNGATGAAGASGSSGAQGAAGASGSNGAQGATGSTGPQGAAGTNGAQGTAGTNGSNGAQGATGAAGAQGAAGSNGSNGAPGAAGSNGAQGSAGAQGSTGAAGPGFSGTAGSVAFLGAGGSLAQDNANFYWNDTKHWLGVGKSPGAALDVAVATGQDPDVRFTNGEGYTLELRPNGVDLDTPSLQTTTPNTQNGDLLFFNTTNTTAADDGLVTEIGFAAAESNGSGFLGAKIGVQFASPATSPATGIYFDVSAGGGLREALRIAPSGNVGIGTTTPAYLLSVNGTVQAAGGVVYPDGNAQTVAFAGANVTETANSASVSSTCANYCNTGQSVALSAAGTYLVTMTVETFRSGGSRGDLSYARLAWSTGSSLNRGVSGMYADTSQAHGNLTIVEKVTTTGADTVNLQVADPYGGSIGTDNVEFVVVRLD